MRHAPWKDWLDAVAGAACVWVAGLGLIGIGYAIGGQ
mgnify:CR=1 FL=1